VNSDHLLPEFNCETVVCVLVDFVVTENPVIGRSDRRGIKS